LNIYISQGSAAAEFRCGGRFYSTIFRSLSANPKVKELLKSVHICQSYRKNKRGTFFVAHGVLLQGPLFYCNRFNTANPGIYLAILFYQPIKVCPVVKKERLGIYPPPG